MTTQTAPRPTIRRMAKPPMTQKTYRVPVTLYEAAMTLANERQENLSDVIRTALEDYVGGRCRVCGNEAPAGENMCPACAERFKGFVWGLMPPNEPSRTS